MKLTYFITGLQFGGAEVGMTRLLSGIEESERAEEFDITVVSLVKTSNDVVELLPDSVDVIHLDIERKHELWKLQRLWSVLRETDLLVCSLFHASAVGVPLGKLARVPRIFTWQHNSEYRSQTARRIYSVCYKLSDKVLADSQAVAEMLETEFSVATSKIATLPIVGVDTDFFHPDAGDITFENDQEFQVGTVGRLVEQKGYDYLIETASRMPDAHFHIIGEGELRTELEEMCREKNVSNVTVHGRVGYEALPRYLGSFDVYFQPSRYEGLCMTVIEAMAAGLPVVASKTGGIQESVVDSKTGYLNEVGDVSGYVRSLSRFNSDNELRRSFSTEAQNRVTQRYSRSELLSEFYHLLDYDDT